MKTKTEIKQVTNSSGTITKTRATVFAFAWGISHFIDESRQPSTVLADTTQGLLHALVFAFAAALMLRPSSRARLAGLAGINVIVAFLQMPNMPNHNMIYFFADLAIIVSLIFSEFSKKINSLNWFEKTEPLLRIVLFVVYGSATLAKLNTSWFNLEISCATSLPTKEFTWLPFVFDWKSIWILPIAVFTTEFVIWLGVLFKKLRPYVLVLAPIFHICLSLTPVSNGLGFTFLLLPLLGLYLPDAAFEDLRARTSGFIATLKAKKLYAAFAYGYVVFAAGVGVNSFVVGDRLIAGFMRYAPSLLLLIAIGFVVAFMALKHRKTKQIEKPISFKYVFQGILLLVVIANSMAPYFGVKTYATMTMFSNLAVENGTTNHLFIPRIQAETMADDLVKVIDTNLPMVQVFEKTGTLYTWHELRRTYAKYPEASITYQRDGKIVTLEHASDNSELVTLDPVLHKILGFRPVSTDKKCLW